MSTSELQFATRGEWLESRRTLGIGSSDAAAILGVSRYKSAYQLFQEKLGVFPSSKGENEQLEWGNTLEEPIAQRYQRETARAVFDPNRAPNGDKRFTIIRSREVDFMIAQIDRLTTSVSTDVALQTNAEYSGVLEIKNAHFFVGKSWLDLQEPPLEFIIQLQHQLAVTGRQWGSIAALIGGCRFVWADLQRDDEFIALLTQAEGEFWERLKRNDPPAPDGSDWTTKALNKLFRAETSGVIVPLPIEAIEWHAALSVARSAEKSAQAKKREYENQIKAAIGDNVGGRLADGTIYTWKTQIRKEFVTKPSSFRVLRVFESRRPELPVGSVSPFEITEGPDTE